MIIDAHCHAWETWPYQPPVPDMASRGRAEQLLHEMDANGVERAVIICARIGNNPRNVDYAFEAAARHAGRLVVFPDLECRWSPDYKQPGAASRLEKALERWDLAGFTHYLDEDDDGMWMVGAEGRAFFTLAARHRLILSLSMVPHQMPAVLALAETFPALPILLHHFAFLGPRSARTANGMELVLEGARYPNVFLKYSGLGNVAAPDQEFPYTPLDDMRRRLAEAYGAGRMVWGSDYPVSRRHMTYKQTLSLLTRHGPFEGTDLDLVLGRTMERLLDTRGPR
ncbi:MAG TPA: amidohydrolase family protein [Devosiaceae bacterium]|jgi:predicted TIM-barrel fold metal-dependent hydrolase